MFIGKLQHKHFSRKIYSFQIIFHFLSHSDFLDIYLPVAVFPSEKISFKSPISHKLHFIDFNPKNLTITLKTKI